MRWSEHKKKNVHRPKGLSGRQCEDGMGEERNSKIWVDEHL